jgi:hypothetical protein
MEELWEDRDCWVENGRKDKTKRNKKKKGNGNNKKDEEANTAEQIILFVVEEELHNFNTYDPCNLAGIDEHLIWYDWLADSAMRSHVMHQVKAFISCIPESNIVIVGVGGKEAAIAGHGTVELILISMVKIILSFCRMCYMCLEHETI